MRGGTLAPFAELYDTTGTLVRTSSTGVLSLPLPATGSYNMLVRDRAGSGTGAYRATLQTEPPCAVNDRTPPAVTLLRPTGGEVAVGGSVFRIAWQSDDNVDVASHDVRLSTDGGQTFPAVIAAGVSGAAQFYDWPVPTSVSPTRTAVVQVTATDGSGNSQSAASDLIALIGSGFKENVNVKLAYDAMNRVTQAAYSDGRTLQYSYDGNGNLVQISVSLP